MFSGAFLDVSPEFDARFQRQVERVIADLRAAVALLTVEEAHIRSVTTLGKQGDESLVELYGLLGRARVLASKEFHDLVDALGERDRVKARTIVARLAPLDIADLVLLENELLANRARVRERLPGAAETTPLLDTIAGAIRDLRTAADIAMVALARESKGRDTSHS